MKDKSHSKIKKSMIIITAIAVVLFVIALISGTMTNKNVDSNANATASPDAENTSAPIEETATPTAEPTEEPTPTPEPEEEKPQTYYDTLEVKKGNVMNGTKTEVLGHYTYVNASKSKMEKTSSEDYIAFIESVLDGTEGNWFLIKFNDGTGIHYPSGTSTMGTYCTIDSDDCIDKTLGTVEKVGDKVIYTESKPVSTQISQGDIEGKIPSKYTNSEWYMCNLAVEDSYSMLDLQIDIKSNSVSTAKSAVNEIYKKVKDCGITDYSFTIVNKGTSVALISFSAGDKYYQIIQNGTVDSYTP